MNWAKENPFLTGFLVFSVVLIGGLGYFTYSQYSTHTELLTTYETEVQKLHSLQNRTPYPNSANLKQMVEAKEQYQAALVDLGKALQTRELPLKAGITPQQFQDELRKAVSNAEKLAASSGMSLPKNFYLGFDNYSANLPTQEAAPHLARELSAIEALFADLTEARVEVLSELSRAPLPVEESRTSAPKNGPNAPAPKLIEKTFLDLTFSGEQGRVRLALNSFLNSPQYALVRAVKIQNNSPLSPPVTADPAAAASPTTPEFSNSETPSPSPRALNMVFGREKITAQVRVELLHFEKIAESGTPKPQ